jgi:hypothetical protein
MGENVQLLVGKRSRYRGTFVRYALQRPDKGAILLRDIIHLQGGVVVLRHHWFARTKGMKPLGELHAGDEVEFNARLWVSSQAYRHQDERARLSPRGITAYYLTHPTKFARVTY